MQIQYLYYMTHFDNLDSIFKEGILCHRLIEDLQIHHEPIYNVQIVQNRLKRAVTQDKYLWDFANLYFQPRNAMLYAVLQPFQQKSVFPRIAILGISKTLLQRKDIYMTTGNAASQESEILDANQGTKSLKQIQKQVEQEWWSKEDGSRRKMMAECLVPERIEPNLIKIVYVACERARDYLKQKLSESGNSKLQEVSITVEPKMFFQPDWKTQLNQHISLVRGDMFFSKMQTLTVSVNCVGVMGKGLASTAKNRFPDVYVQYQNVCRNKLIKLGTPYLYKRESSILEDLADPIGLDSQSMYENTSTWFLLFPTKDHWKNISKIEEIEKGLQWLVKNYQKAGIQSLAMPALGCGLGGLKWKEVGPLMCQYLSLMDIPIAIYLPAEQQLADELLSPEFLISKKQTP